jgi:hypothetical protein
MSRTQSYYDLLDAFGQDDCPICRLALASVCRYIEAINYESVGDPTIRRQLGASLGFCNEHAYQWLRQAHVLGTATIYLDVLTRLTERLQEVPFRRQTLLTGVVSLLAPRANREDREDACAVLEPTGRCPACGVLEQTEKMLVDTLLAGLSEPAFSDAYTASAGLCLPHLRLVFCQTDDEAAFKVLRDVAAVHQERLLEHLREIIRRHDYRFAGGPAGAERGARERAVRYVVGAHGAGRPEPWGESRGISRGQGGA